MIACPHPPCEVTRESVGHLTAHLVDVHLVAAHVALKEAAQAAEQPVGAPIITAPESQSAERVQDKSMLRAAPGRVLATRGAHHKEAPVPSDICGYCKRPKPDHSKNCKYRGGCKRCAKRAPDKCPLHGGTHLRSGKHGGTHPTGKQKARQSRNRAQPALVPAGNGPLRVALLQEKGDLEAQLRVIDRMLARASG